VLSEKSRQIGDSRRLAVTALFSTDGFGSKDTFETAGFCLFPFKDSVTVTIDRNRAFAAGMTAAAQ
jgi:hypothetical protein